MDARRARERRAQHSPDNSPFRLLRARAVPQIVANVNETRRAGERLTQIAISIFITAGLCSDANAAAAVDDDDGIATRPWTHHHQDKRLCRHARTHAGPQTRTSAL